MFQTGPDVLYKHTTQFPKKKKTTQIELTINTTHREENSKIDKNKNVIKKEGSSDASKRWSLVIPEKNALKFCE